MRWTLIIETAIERVWNCLRDLIFSSKVQSVSGKSLKPPPPLSLIYNKERRHQRRRQYSCSISGRSRCTTLDSEKFCPHCKNLTSYDYEKIDKWFVDLRFDSQMSCVNGKWKLISWAVDSGYTICEKLVKLSTVHTAYLLSTAQLSNFHFPLTQLIWLSNLRSTDHLSIFS